MSDILPDAILSTAYTSSGSFKANIRHPEGGHLDKDASSGAFKVGYRGTPRTTASRPGQAAEALDWASLAGAVVLGGRANHAAAGWGFSRSAYELYTLNSRGQSLDPLNNREARGPVIDMFAYGMFGAAAGGRKLLGLRGTGAAALDFTAGIAGSAAIANTGAEVAANWDKMTDAQRAWAALQLGFFGKQAFKQTAGGYNALRTGIAAQRRALGIDPRTPEEYDLVAERAGKGQSVDDVPNALGQMRANNASAALANRIAELRGVDDPAKVAESRSKDERYAARKAETEERAANETQLGHDLEVADQSKAGYDAMRTGNVKSGERKPLTFRSWEQYQQFQTEFQEAMKGIRVDGKPVTAQAQVIGSATTFYSNNPDKPLGHHFDRNRAEGDTSDMDIDLYSPEMAKHMARLPNPAVNDKVMVGGEKTIFKSNGAGGLYSQFPQLEEFARRWKGILGRDIEIKLKIDITPVEQIKTPRQGPIEFFRKEGAQ